MSEGLIVMLAILIFVIVTIAKGVRIVSQGEEWVVERLGCRAGFLYRKRCSLVSTYRI